MTKILIGCPTCDRYDYCVNLWVSRVKEIIKKAEENKIEADYLLVDNSKEDKFFNEMKNKGVKIIKEKYYDDVKKRVVESRNVLRDKAINEGFDYFLSLEQDVIPPADVIMRLLSHDVKIVSAYYGKLLDVVLQDNETKEFKSATIELPVVYMEMRDGIRQASPPEVLNKGLIIAGAYGVGCLLIHREVLEKIKFRYEEDKKAFDDFLFCYDAKKLGYKLYLDSDLRVEHLHMAWEEGIL